MNGTAAGAGPLLPSSKPPPLTATKALQEDTERLAELALRVVALTSIASITADLGVFVAREALPILFDAAARYGK